ncbi:MAG: hypothetical protein ACUVQ0_05075 [Thermoproteota archaeon]
MRLRRGNRRIPILLTLLLIACYVEQLATMVSGQFLTISDFLVFIEATMDEDAVAIYNLNITMGPKAITSLREADWLFKIKLPKWATPHLVRSRKMPMLMLENGVKIQLEIQKDADYDYLVAEIPPVEDEALNASIKIGFLQRDDISGRNVGFNIPILTGFNIVPEYVNFTFITTGEILEYSKYLRNFTMIFSNETVRGLWGSFFRTEIPGNLTGVIKFPRNFEKSLIESLRREILVSEDLSVLVKDYVKVKYRGVASKDKLLEIVVPDLMSQSVRASDALGPLKSSTSFFGPNLSSVTVYARYTLEDGYVYEALLEYVLPIKNIVKNVQDGIVTIELRDFANYTDVVNLYSLSVRVGEGKEWRITIDSETMSLGGNENYSEEIVNAIPDIMAKTMEISLNYTQLETGRSFSLIVGLLALLVLIVANLFRGETAILLEEAVEKKEVESLTDKLVRMINEKIDYESLIEEIMVKNALGKLSSREYRVSLEEYNRRITGAEKKILNIIEQISLKNPRVGDEIRKTYGIFEEINRDLRKMLGNAVERFKGGKMSKSMFENISGKYLKDNRKRREAVANEVYKHLERLGT